jgi:cytochrome c oxidase subunit 3
VSTSGDPRTAREGAIPGAGVLGMWIFLATLGMLFAASIAGYLVVRLRAPEWPPPGMPRLPRGLWITTLVIVACSVTIGRAVASMRLGQTTRATRWLQATLGLGLIFLAAQAINWWVLVTAHVTAQTKNLYAFTFYMLTGLHAAHVIGGLILLGVVIARAGRGRYGSGHYDGITYAAMYWHFLDVVWVVLFAVLLIFA